MNKPVSTPATKALEAAGVEYEPLPYDHDPRVTNFGLEAAHALGRSPDQVFKTLVVRVDESLFGVVCVPVSGEADLKAVAAALGGKKAAMATPDDVRRLTGYVLGGVSPIGQRTRLSTVLDESVLHCEQVCVSGGRRGFDVALAPRALVEVTDAVIADVAR